jgi:hypothetical protein
MVRGGESSRKLRDMPNAKLKAGRAWSKNCRALLILTVSLETNSPKLFPCRRQRHRPAPTSPNQEDFEPFGIQGET